MAKVDLTLLRRDRAALFWSYVGPFIFMTFFGLLKFGGPDRIALYLENQDSSLLIADAVKTLLREQNIDVRRGRAPEGRYTLVVPQGATEIFAQGGVPSLILETPVMNPDFQEQALVASAYRTMLGTLLGLEPVDARAFLDNPAVLDSASLQSRLVVRPSLQLSEQGVTLAAEISGFQRYIPAYLVMFVLMNAMAGGAVMLVMERKTGQLRRMLTSSVGPAAVVLGKITSRMLWTWSQIGLMVLAGAFIYRIHFGAHPLALLVVLMAFSVVASALGIAFGAFFKNPDKAGGFGSLVVMLLAPLGGLWWPIEFAPGWMRSLADYLPTHWAFDALNRIMALNAGLSEVWPSVLLLLALSAVCLPLASWRILQSD